MRIIMKSKIYLLIITIGVMLAGCDKESNPTASDDLGIVERFSPGEDAAPEVKSMYNEYGVWVRTHFNSVEELANSILATDQIIIMRGAENLEEEKVPEVINYSQRLLENVSKEYTNKFFPLEFFYVKQYGSSYWIYPVRALGRSRLIVMWPNTEDGVIPVTDPVNHYYQDSVLTAKIWSALGEMITARMEEPMTDFVAAGKAYDDGAAYEKLGNEYDKDEDAYLEEHPDEADEEDEDIINQRPYVIKYKKALDDLCRNGGYLSGTGSRSFENDFADWLRVLATESYDNIKANYLDNSKSRAMKYDIIIKYFKQFNWDIQAAGNKYRQKYNEYKATLPPPSAD